MCRRFKIFSGLLFAFVLSFFFYSSSYATSVDCSIDKSTSYQSSVFSLYSYYLSDICSNFDSLDSSKTWYFSIDITTNKSIVDDFSWTAWAVDSSSSGPYYSYNYPNFVLFRQSRRQPDNSSYSFSFVSSTPYSVKPYVISPSGNNYQLLQDYYVFDSFTISDEGLPSSGDCPVCEECQECPAVPENPYDEKLDNITQAIYVCAAVVLVVYFFYCIYRMLIKNSGVK